MKKKRVVNALIVSALFIGIFFLPASSVLAYEFDVDSGLGQTGSDAGYFDTGLTGRTPAEIIGIAIGIILGFIGVAFLGLMIFAGYTWMMARGNQAEVDKAKKMIESAIIGLIIVLAAYAITYFVGQSLA